MSDNQPQSSQPASTDPAALLSRLVPSDQSERRRAMAALLRALTEDDQQKPGLS